jgi:hypothetical protein
MAKGKWQNSNRKPILLLLLVAALPCLVSRNAQPLPQRKLQPGHFAMILFVIVAQQVEDTVQDKPSDLVQGRVSFQARVSLGRVDGNDDVAEEVLELRNNAFLGAPAFMPRSPTPASGSRGWLAVRVPSER